MLSLGPRVGQKRGAPSRGAGEQQRGAPSPRGAGRNPSDQDAKRRNAQRVFKLYTSLRPASHPFDDERKNPTSLARSTSARVSRL